MNSNLTLVTGIWDLKRDQAGEGFKRPFSHYTENFVKLLRTEANMVVYIEKQHEDLVWQNRNKENTRVIIKEVDSFKNDSVLTEEKVSNLMKIQLLVSELQK